jgi:LysR family transcriptional regulator (chromosome initiation inhibitor)
MLPELQLAQLESGTLTPLTPAARVDIPLYWQQWRLTTAALDRIASAITDAAQALQPQPAKALPGKHRSRVGQANPVPQIS